MGYLLLCGLVLILFIATASSAAPNDFDGSCLKENVSETTVVLLDTYNYMTLPWGSISLDEDNVTWVIMNGSSVCQQTADTCTVGLSLQRNILVTQYITTPSKQVQVIVDFVQGTCPTGAFDGAPPMCPSTFSIYIYNASSEISSGIPSFGDFRLVQDPVVTGAVISITTTTPGFYLAFEDTGTCASITRVRVTYSRCLATTYNLAEYAEQFSGESVLGSCVANSNSAGAELTAQCSLDGSFDFTNAGDCTCNDGYDVMGNQCNVCSAGYYRSSGNCQVCPTNSERPSGMNENACLCLGSTSTSDNAINTTGLACDGCAGNSFLKNATMCEACPSNSMSASLNDMFCICVAGTVLPDSSNVITTGEACSDCAINYFREAGMCKLCPANSVRDSTAATVCTCGRDYARASNDKCVPIVGFRDASIMIVEGELTNLILYLSTTVNNSISIVVDMTPASVPGVDVGNTELGFARNTFKEIVPVTVQGNEIALENVTFGLQIAATAEVVIGGMTPLRNLSGSIMVTIRDDDSLVVGFTMSKVTFFKSSTNAAVSIITKNAFAMDFDLKITSNDDSVVKVTNPLVTLTANTEPNFMMEVPLEILKSGQAALSLELVDPNILEVVKLGGENTEKEITVGIDSAEGFMFSIEAIIGVCVAGMALALLLLLIVIFCLCICRVKVNRQGFYHTYEDKTSEPPTMLRYSASLRSITSQTIVPITEGRAITKENEFYV